MRKAIHTSFLSRPDRRPQPKHELRSSNDRETNRGWKVFHHHGVYPAVKFSGVNPEPLKKKESQT
jgi:hypothetical protein